MKKSIPLPLAILSTLAFSTCARSLPFEVIDTHVHLETQGVSADLASLVDQMDSKKFNLLFLMETPSPVLSATGSQMAALASLISSAPTRFKLLYGGGDLAPIVHALGRPNASSLTLQGLYPNGGGSQTDVDQIKTVAASVAAYTTQFQTNATTAAASGLYRGFGEFAPYHASRRSGHPFIEYPVNHSLMTWLADLAATNNLPIDLHIEAVDSKMDELSSLCAHNRSTKIVWQHAGWSDTGGSSAALIDRMLTQNSNLYVGIKIRPPTSKEMEASSVFDEDGKIKSEWTELIKKYAHRIMIGTDAKFFQEGASAKSTMLITAPSVADFLSQLPSEIATRIANGTAKDVYNL